MRHLQSLLLIFALVGIGFGNAVDAKSKTNSPSLSDYKDVGRGLGMEWFFHADNGNPVLEFGVKETSHRLDRLWEFSCAGLKSNKIAISNTIFAKPREVRRNDEFGFSIRVDNGESFGLIGRRTSFEIQGTQAFFPQFRISQNHDLWSALQRGQRAFVNLNGTKFSIHLDGSANAIQAFLNACKKRSL
ncbi:MAG: hypothetical protein Pars2KO_19710 [Parasphingorhabdus sp.]